MENFTSQNIGELAGALAKAQGKILPALKECSNPFYKSKYADLASVTEACRGPLSENGLSVIQSIVTREDGAMSLVTLLAHASGEWIKSDMKLDVAKKDPHTLGALITYYRRYALSALVGVAQDDDDGERAQAPYRKQSEDHNNLSREYKNSHEKISQSQAKDISMILDECEPEYKEKVLGHLKTKYKATLEEMPKSIFDQVKSKATEKMLARFEEQQKERSDISFAEVSA